MDQKQLKTSWSQRIVIGVIAFLMLFSTVAVYALIVLSNEKKAKNNADVSAELEKLKEELTDKKTVLEAKISELSNQYYGKMSGYRSLVRSYNANSVDTAGLKTTDLEIGTGAEITEDSSYYSYYIGWCADESVFDSSFDVWDGATALVDPLAYVVGESSFVAGWEEGVIGMKTGGVREIDIPGELAYGDTQEVCGALNSPLKYLVMVIDQGSDYKKLMDEYDNLVTQYYILYYSQNQDLLTNNSAE